MRNSAKAKGSAGNNPSGAPAATLRAPIASRADDERLLTIEQLYDLLALAGVDRCEENVRDVPFVLVGTVRRWMRDQAITWAALGGSSPRAFDRISRVGGTKPRHVRGQRGVP